MTERTRRGGCLKTILRLTALILIPLTAFGAWALYDAWDELGTAPEGARLALMERSSQWADDSFVNPEPIVNDHAAGFGAMFGASDDGAPRDPLGPYPIDPARFATPPAGGLRATWLGHSTVLVEIDGKRFLTDPVFSARTSPVDWAGPERWYPPPLPLEELPPLDAVLLSHDHYDHLDADTIRALATRVPRFLVPLGLGAHLEGWGVPADRITELDWWARAEVGGVTLVCVPARHASGRHLFDRDRTLWSGWAILGDERRVYFSGDTGLFGDMRRIGRELGPFDLAMIEVGAYHRAWPDWHVGPEQAVTAAGWVDARRLLPIHWGLFRLAPHAWTEPIERTIVAAEAAALPITTPRPGQSWTPDASPAERWWPETPWETAAEHPVVSGGVRAPRP